MATITPVAASVIGTVVAPATPTANDVIPASAYNYIHLIIQSSTGTPTVTVTDQTSQNPPGTLVQSGDFDVTATLTSGQTRIMRLDCARFRDGSGNINIATTNPANSTIMAVGLL